jgi:dipeptidyl aminopeptidase/acylaminoacyl peptidase
MKRTMFAAVVLVCALGAKDFTLEQVMSAPFPSELTAAPGGGKVAWILNERGARNVWIASSPDFRGTRLTNYTEDDGIELGQLRWMPDASAVVFVRGGDLEFLGRADPNPTANPSGTEQAILIAAPGSAPRKIADGHSPILSPKGDRVVFTRGGQLWVAPTAGGMAQMVFKPRSGVTSGDAVWSPDGSQVAFVSDRGNHSFIAVYGFETKALTYMDPSVDRDTNPAWSPDSKQLAFMRRQAGGGGRAGRAGNPWAIRVATVADGSSRQIWKADAGPGSLFHAVVADRQLVWGAGDRIVFPWEKDGWDHLYSVAVEGGRATLLTPGEFEVEHVSYSDDGKEAVYSSNQGDIDRRHIWRVPVAGGTPQAVTKGESIEWDPVFAGGGVAYLRSDARQPARAAIQLGGTAKDLAPETMPKDFPAADLVVPQQVIYTASDGMQIHAQLFVPAGVKAGEKRKAVVFMHGGSRRQMLLGWHYRPYYTNAYALNQLLANQGHIVLSINYRSGTGYGLNFREAIDYGSGGASEYHDVEGAGLYLRSRPDVDPKHVGLWGGSYGGYLTAMGLARGSDLFSAGVDFHGVHDWSMRMRATGRASEEALRTAFESSPLASVRTWRSPVLLIHGDDDRNVDFAQTVDLAAALRRQGVEFEQLILPDEIHGFLRHASWLRAYRASVDFLKRKL